jgi:hypothetical protein
VKLRLVRAVHTAVVKRGGPLSFTLSTKFGARSFPTARTTRLARPASHHRR